MIQEFERELHRKMFPNVAGRLSGSQHHRICPVTFSLSLGMDIPPPLWAAATVLTHPYSIFFSFYLTGISMLYLATLASCLLLCKSLGKRLALSSLYHPQPQPGAVVPLSPSKLLMCRDQGLAHQL